VERYPNSPLIQDGRQRLREAKDNLGMHDYNVGYFYFRTMKWYPGAIDRFLALLKEDPEFSNRDRVYFYLAQSLIKMNQPAQALPYLDKLIAEFEQSEFLAEAQKLSADLKAEMVKKSGSPSYVP
jgi:outer membrane protein assembly factor BamD